jgi:Leu/Phe-tRNA-protein transferase
MIAIYNNDHAETLAHVCDTLESAATWIGCTVQALYKSMHLQGVMSAKGFTIEKIN